MREWFKKYLGLLGFGTWMAFTLLFVLDEFIYVNTSIFNKEILFIGFLIMVGAQTIQDILNEKYFTKYSKRVKNGIILFIITMTIGLSFLAY
tara:strand:+ start:143 stop:418 length:276 start_codon:yes stop_codon:yes gene_type:complete